MSDTEHTDFRDSRGIMSRRRRRPSSSSSESDSNESWSCSGESESEEELCDYEKRRLDNIRRNQQMMRSLGKYRILSNNTAPKKKII